MEEIKEELSYFCIDLKCFYASVECVERGLDPFKTNLVVADETRGGGSICLAISPKMKALGVHNRCRLFEIPKNIDYICAMPRMRKYIEYSSLIYSIYLRFFSKEDIHVYSIDEVFIYCKPYLKMYNKSAFQIAKMVSTAVFDETGIFASCGIGSNLYLAKIAMDIKAKHTRDGIAILTVESYKQELWNYTPLTDFWNVGRGITNRLNKLGIHTMEEVAKANPKLLYKELGINAEYLIDHANGIETCTIKEIKNYVPKSKSISNGMTLDRDYSYDEGLLAFKELVVLTVLDLVSKRVVTDTIGFAVGYATPGVSALDYRHQQFTGGSRKIDERTNSYEILSKEMIDLFIRNVDRERKIRRISVYFTNILSDEYEIYTFFTDREKIKKEKKLQETIVDLKDKYGKGAVLRGMNLDPSAQTIKRNKLIGGHNAE